MSQADFLTATSVLKQCNDEQTLCVLDFATFISDNPCPKIIAVDLRKYLVRGDMHLVC